MVPVPREHARRPQRMIVHQASLLGRNIDVAVSESSGEASERDGRRLVEDVMQLAIMQEQVVERGNATRPALPQVLDRLHVWTRSARSDEVLDPGPKNPITRADMREELAERAHEVVLLPEVEEPKDAAAKLIKLCR